MCTYGIYWDYMIYLQKRDVTEAKIEREKHMEEKMKILVIEDDTYDCNLLLKSAKCRKDIEIIAITDSDIEALKLIEENHPDGIILDLELNNSIDGNTDSIELLNQLKNIDIDYMPIIIVTTHVNSKKTYELLHKKGVDLILYKEQPNFSYDRVFNSFTNFKKPTENVRKVIDEQESKKQDDKISNIINNELDLIGVTSKLKGRKYLHDAIFYLVKEEKSKISIIQYLTNKYKKSSSTITNGMQNAIIHAWRVTPIEDLEKYYRARVNYETGIPTPMEFIYYYVEETKKKI